LLFFSCIVSLFWFQFVCFFSGLKGPHLFHLQCTLLSLRWVEPHLHISLHESISFVQLSQNKMIASNHFVFLWKSTTHSKYLFLSLALLLTFSLKARTLSAQTNTSTPKHTFVHSLFVCHLGYEESVARERLLSHSENILWISTSISKYSQRNWGNTVDCILLFPRFTHFQVKWKRD
jgi:hypothetical protein